MEPLLAYGETLPSENQVLIIVFSYDVGKLQTKVQVFLRCVCVSV